MRDRDDDDTLVLKDKYLSTKRLFHNLHLMTHIRSISETEGEREKEREKKRERRDLTS